MDLYEFYNIEDKNIKIASYNIEKGIKEYKPIEALVYKGIGKKYECYLPTGDILVKASADHRMYDIEKKKYVAMKDVTEMTLLTNSGDIVKCFVRETDEEIPLLDMSVADNHNYFVNGVLCSNTGGYALKYAASTTFRTRKIENLTEGSKVVGIHINCKNYKNKTGVPFRECEMDLYFKGGFNSDGEFIDFIAEFSEDPRLSDLITYGGGYYKSKKLGTTYHGKKAFQDAINDGSFTLWEDVKKTIMDIISNVIDGKENTIDPEDEDQNHELAEEATDNVE